MSYTLLAVNPTVDPFKAGSVWLWLIRRGLGLVIGCDTGLSDHSVVYIPQGNDAHPLTCTGYRITRQQAVIMAYITRQILTIEDQRRQQFAQLTPIDQKHRIDHRIQPLPIEATWLDRSKHLAAWMARSEGFRVY